MRKIILTLIISAMAFAAFAQPATNGAINGKSKSGMRHEVGIDSMSPNRFRLGVNDSTGNVYLLALKLKADSIYTKIMSSLAVTGTFWQATQPVSGTFWQATQPISFPRLKSSTDTVTVYGSVTIASGIPAEAIISERGTDSTYMPGDRAPVMADENGVTFVRPDSITFGVLESSSNSLGSIQANMMDIDEVTRGVIVGNQTITTQNVTPTNTTTTASYVNIIGGAHGYASASIHVTGTYTGALSLQVIADDGSFSTWTQVGLQGYKMTFRNVKNGEWYDSIPSGQQGVYEINIASMSGVRITALGPVTGTATIWGTVSTNPRVANEVLQMFQTAGQPSSGVYGLRGNTATTVAAPTYVTGTDNPISTNVRGDVRTHDTLVYQKVQEVNAKLPALSNGKIPVDSVNIKSMPGVTLSGTATYDSTWTTTAMTITDLSALASSATAGWQSARVSNLANKALDYKIGVRLSYANTAPANDKACYIYAVAWFTTDGGTTWYHSTGGNANTLFGTSDSTYTMASPGNFTLLGVLNYTTQDMNPCGVFNLSNAFGTLPDGWSLVIINFTGAALETTSGTNNIVYYSPVNKTQR